MPNGPLAQRVGTLEEYMKDLSFQALRTEREIARLSQEMRDFKDEMLEFKDEMRVFKDEMGAFKDEMRVFKDEMSTFKDEMGTFKTQAELDRREMNRKWGELANKMGTLVEDIVAPNLPRVAQELFRCGAPQWAAIRIKRREGPETMEIDALVVCEGTVLVNETKSSLYSRDVDDLLTKIARFGEFFQEFAQRRIVGIVASLYVDESVVRYATSRKVLAMGMREDTMRILNPEAAAA
jgi:hypothetical protein